MSRTIKFRAWSKQEVRWLDEGDYAVCNCGNILLRKSGTMEYHCVSTDAYSIFLFSGLLDTNGKEIYEGDIIKWFTDSMWKFGSIVYGTRGWEVHWSAAEPERREWRERPVVFEFQSFWPLSSEHHKGDGDAKLEVIGNIYENPELLSV